MTSAPTHFNSTGSSTPQGDAWPQLDMLLNGNVLPFWSRLPWYLPAFIAVGLGLSFLLTNGLFETNVSWRIMGTTFGQHSQAVWGAMFLGCGSVHIALKYARHGARWVTAFALVSLFCFMAASLTFSSGFLSTGTIAYGGYALLAIWAVVRPQ